MSHLLESIGAYFFRNLVEGDFSLDPIGSFEIDKNVSSDVVGVLRNAAYQGAIVYMDPEGSSFNNSLVRKRFRLSFMLAPNWKLPLRTYDKVALSKILPGAKKTATTNTLELDFGEIK